MLGYGEDALTLWALTHQLREVLRLLEDGTAASDATVIFRPSFGRNSTRTGGTRRSEFGEFDALIGTPEAAYLIEAKWGSSQENENGEVRLRDEQQRRHTVFRWYLSQWQQFGPTSWPDFRQTCLPAFEAEFPSMTLPGAGTVLARNLEFVLKTLAPSARRIVDVVLFVSVDGSDMPTRVWPESFRLVMLRADKVGGAGYIRL